MVVITPSMDRVFPHKNIKTKQEPTERIYSAKPATKRRRKNTSTTILTHCSLSELSTGRHHTRYQQLLSKPKQCFTTFALCVKFK